MDNQIDLSDYEAWKKANNNSFSKISYIHGIINSQKISYDLYFAFLDMFWPEFIVRSDMVFIKDSFDEKQDLLKNTYKDDKEKEFWINLLSIDGLFSEEIDEDKLDFLSKKIAESWKAKLKQDFPERKFKIVVANDEDDVAVSFHQI